MYLIDKIVGKFTFKHKNFYVDWTKDCKYLAIQYTVNNDISGLMNKICVWDIEKKQKYYEILDTPECNKPRFSADDTKIVSFCKLYHNLFNKKREVKENLILHYQFFDPEVLKQQFLSYKDTFNEWIEENIEDNEP